MMDLYQAWRSGKVNRMHTMPQTHRENIAEHTWGLLFLILRIWPDAPRDFIVAAIFHDAGEIATGDIPGHIKWSNPDLKSACERLEAEHIAQMMVPVISLSPAETILLEIFDRLEFVISAMHEFRIGNQNSREYMVRSYGKAEKLVAELAAIDKDQEYSDTAQKVTDEVFTMMRQYGSFVK